eukprot:EG_transcript_1704
MPASPPLWPLFCVLLWLLRPSPTTAQQMVPSIHSTVTFADPGGAWVTYTRLSRVATGQPAAQPLLLVLWESNAAVRGRLLRTAPGAALPPPAVGDPFNVSAASASLALCNGPCSAAAPTADGFVVAWAAAPGPAQKYTVRLRYYTVGGLTATPASPAMVVSQRADVSNFYPAVASCGGGEVVAWGVPDSNTAEALWLDRAGWNASYRVTSATQDARPAVACLGEGSWVVVYSVGPGALYYQVFNRTGPTLGPLPIPSAGPQPSGLSRPSVARVSNLSFVVAWDSGQSSTQYSTVDLTGTPTIALTTVGSTGNSQSLPRIAALDSRSAIVAWRAGTATARIVSTSGTTALGLPKNVTAGPTPGEMPDVAGLGDRYFALTYCTGGAVVVRLGKANAPPVLQYSVVAQTVRSGAPFSFGFPLPLFSDPEGDPVTVTAVLSSGRPLPSWLEYNSSTGLFLGAYPNSTTVRIDLVASDGFDTASATFVLMVRTPPTAHPVANHTVVAGRAFALAVSDVFTDPDSSFTVTAVVQAAPGGMELALPWITVVDIWVLFSPPRNTSVGDQFVVLVADDGAFNGTASFFLRVTANTAPVVWYPLRLQFGSPQFSRTKQLIFTFAANTFVDLDGDPLTYTAQLAGNSTLPRWLTFVPDTRTFLGNPDYMDDETVVVMVVASDGLDSVSDAFTIALYYPASTTTLMVAAVLSVGLVVVIVIGLWFYAKRHRSTQTEALSAEGGSPVTVAPRPLASHLPCVERQECAPAALTPEELELQAFMEKEYPDLIDPISGEVMRDPVVTSAGQSYSRHELLKHLELRCTDPLTNLPLNPEQPFEPNHTLKKVVMAIIAKWQDERHRAAPLEVPAPPSPPSAGCRCPSDISAPLPGDPHVPDAAESQELLKP